MRTYKTPYKAEKLNYGNDDEWLVTRREDNKTLVVKGAGNRKATIFLASQPAMNACWG